MPVHLHPPSLTRWARESLARLRVRRGRRVGRFRLSPHLGGRAERLLRGWIGALDPGIRARLPELEVASAAGILRVRGKILLEDGARRPVSENAPALGGDRSTLAVSYVRERVLVLHRRLFRQRWLGQRLFYHELCHFLWPRLGSGARRGFVVQLRRELARGARGELGYSAQYRKQCLAGARKSSYVWRDYSCESFCDTGAYALARRARLGGRLASVEFTLPARYRRARLNAWWRTLAGENTIQNRPTGV